MVTAIATKEPEDRKIKCPECGYTETVRHGFNLTKSKGNRARRKCKRCAHTFYEGENKK